jgi:hypothetical protein
VGANPLDRPPVIVVQELAGVFGSWR